MKTIFGAGEPAPDFTLRCTPDQSVSLNEFRGRPVASRFTRPTGRRSKSREWRMLGCRGRGKHEMDWLIYFNSTSRVLS